MSSNPRIWLINFFFNCTLSIGRLLFQALYFMKVLLSITIFFFPLLFNCDVAFMQSSILLLKQQMLSLNEEKKMCQLKKLLF